MKTNAKHGLKAANLPAEAFDGTVDILLKLYEAYTDGDADLVEINPLILTPEGKMHVLDAKVTLDGNSVFRHENTNNMMKHKLGTSVKQPLTRKAFNM